MSENGLEPQALLESLNDGIYAVDRDRRILYWSRSAERITGWSEKDILGKRCSDDVLSHVDKQGRPLCGSERCPLHRSMVTGIPLGLQTDFDYDELNVSVVPGDCLVAFTDGAIEIGDVNGELLGTDGLVKILNEVGYPDSKDFEAIEEKLLKFSDRIRFNDDLTFMETRFM